MSTQEHADMEALARVVLFSVATAAYKDTETLASLDSIDRNLAAAKRDHEMLCGCCLEDNVDTKITMACCQTIDDALGKAISEHDALMQRLGETQPGEK